VNTQVGLFLIGRRNVDIKDEDALANLATERYIEGLLTGLSISAVALLIFLWYIY
jgi:hypothetical protein